MPIHTSVCLFSSVWRSSFKLQNILGDATEAVKLEFRIIEHESQHMDKKEKHKNTDELSPNKRKDGNSTKPGKHKRPKVPK